MRLFVSLFTAAALLLTASTVAHADSIQLSVNSSISAIFDSPNDNYWGVYSTTGSPSSGYASGQGGATVQFSSVSVTVPAGSIIESANIEILFSNIPTMGTGALFPVQELPPPDQNDQSIAPTFNSIGSSSAMIFDVLGPRLPIIDGDEVSTGDLTLDFIVDATIHDYVATPGYNWTGYLSGSGEAEIPYTVELDVNYSTVPEPSSIALLGTGLLGLAGFARRKFIA